MADDKAPWEKYAAPAQDSGPWAKYASPAQQSTPQPMAAGSFQTQPGGPVQNVNTLGNQPIQYPNQQAAVSGAMARSQLPNFPQQVQQSQGSAAASMPAIGGTIGSVGGPIGFGAGTALGAQAEQRMSGQPVTFTGPATKGAIAGTTAYVGGKLIEGGAGLAGKVIGKLSGATKAIAEAEEERAIQLAEQQEAIRQRGIGVRQNLAKADELQQKIYDYAAKNTPRTAEEANIQQLNKAINAPAKARIAQGASDFSEATVNAGRGLAKEGFDPATLSKMSPQAQTDAITPAWNKAGQAVDGIAAKATAKGTTVNLYQIDDAIDKIQDPQVRDWTHKAILRIGDSIGIKDWGNVSPTDALALRRQLWNSADQDASRYISTELRKAVPELKLIDQHYADLNAASDAARSGMKRIIAGKPVTIPKSGPSMTDFKPAVKLTKIPPTPPPVDRAAITQAANANLRSVLLKAGVLGGVAGAGEEIVRRSLSK